jgi:predicted flap endonuclease-1-like 5' DNA nuclease
VASGVPLEDDDVDVAPPPVPLAGDFAGIAFPPHSTDHPDELTRLKGVGPKLETMLNEEGITRYEQLASLDPQELAALEERLGAFKGRLTRDRVVEQARLLASGDTEGFEATFGKLGGA